MCGRFALQTPIALDKLAAETPESLRPSAGPRAEIAPTQWAAITPMHDPGHIHLFRWGLIPHWAKDKRIASRLINARAETLTEKPAFRSLIASHRCVVLADAFYEWQLQPNGSKQRMRIGLAQGGVFPMAGLFDWWRDASGELLPTFTIITVAPNALMAPIHDRMPALLTRAQALAWLSHETSQAAALSLLKPYDSEVMKADAM